MQVPTIGSLVAATLCTIFVLHFRTTEAISVAAKSLLDPELTLAVLQDVKQLMQKKMNSADMEKRRVDAGYGSRYGVANSVGSKLMALKQAADWNGPGRKKREATEHHADLSLRLAVLDELINNINSQEGSNFEKRRMDAGYGNRYGVASSVGSKLMALKQAADWNGPGRRKRNSNKDEDAVDEQ